MIPSIQQELTLSVPLTLADHHSAELFYQRLVDDPLKAKQVYLNTLAVRAVRSYLAWMGIESDLEKSDSWNPVIQALSDVADLKISGEISREGSGQNKLECRPVLPNATACYIPSETSADCIGYVPVLFDAELKTATLLGFMHSDAVHSLMADGNADSAAGVPLSCFQSVTSIFNYIYQPEPIAEINKQITSLKEWLKGAVDSSWQTIETLLEPPLALSFRSLELPNSADIRGATARGKLLKLTPRHPISNQLPTGGLQSADRIAQDNPSDRAQSDHEVALIVGISPIDSLQSNILVKLCPVGGDRYLPEGLEVRILDAERVAVMEAQARQVDMLQLNFKGIANEQFAIEVALRDADWVEDFTV